MLWITLEVRIGQHLSWQINLFSLMVHELGLDNLLTEKVDYSAFVMHIKFSLHIIKDGIFLIEKVLQTLRHLFFGRRSENFLPQTLS